MSSRIIFSSLASLKAPANNVLKYWEAADKMHLCATILSLKDESGQYNQKNIAKNGSREIFLAQLPSLIFANDQDHVCIVVVF